MNTAHGKPRIVVGVDESPASLAALRWAAREAGLRAARLQVVQAWERARWRVAPYASCVRLRGTGEDRSAAGADLLVLGGVASTGRDAIGPVARDCLRHPPCPIVVVSWERADVPVPV